MLRYIFIVLIIVLIVFGLINYILIKVLRIFSKYSSALNQTQKETDENDKVIYKNDKVVILKGEADRKKQNMNEGNG